MNEERRIEVEEVDGVPPPPKARVDDAAETLRAQARLSRRLPRAARSPSRPPAERRAATSTRP